MYKRRQLFNLLCLFLSETGFLVLLCCPPTHGLGSWVNSLDTIPSHWYPIIIWICWVWGMIILFFSFYFHTCQGHVWKFYHLIIVSTFRLTNWNTLDQISAHNSHNKYGFQAIDQVQIFLLALLLEKFLRRLQYFFWNFFIIH